MDTNHIANRYGSDVAEVVAELSARFGVDVAAVVLEPDEPVPPVSVPDELGELIDDISTGMVLLADDTAWLAGDPGVDPLEYRATVAEFLCRSFAEFLDAVAPA